MVDFGLTVKLGLAALTIVFAVFAIVNEYRSNDIDRHDRPRLKSLARFGTYSAVVCGVLALAIVGIDALLHTGNDPRVAAAEKNAPTPTQAPIAPSDASRASPSGGIQSPPVQPAAPAVLPTFAADTGRAAAPPPLQYSSAGPPASQASIGGRPAYIWDAPPAPRGRDADDLVAERHPPKVVFPYTPVAFTVVLRFSSDDPAIKPFVDRVLRQAERESGIPLTGSSDKFASLKLSPTDEIVYADGKQARLGRPKAYIARKDEAAAWRYLFAPQVHVTLAQPSGARATFTKSVSWAGIKQDQSADALDVYVFPQRKRVVLTITANCLPAQGQFPDGAPSVYDLRGGTVAAQLVKVGDLAVPKVVDLDDVDRHGAAESNRLAASMAPRVRPTIVRILCATSPAGSVELGVDDATVQRSSLDRETSEVCGPVALVGFPAEPPPPRP